MADVIIIIFFGKIVFSLDKIIYITLYIPQFLFFNIVLFAAREKRELSRNRVCPIV
jgi:hypothetical protein